MGTGFRPEPRNKSTEQPAISWNPNRCSRWRMRPGSMSRRAQHSKA